MYSDMNYYLLSRVVEQVTGRTTAAFLQEKLFNPLHFRGNAWGTCPQGHTLGGTGLFLRARDLAAYGYMLACGGVYESRRFCLRSGSKRQKGRQELMATVFLTPPTIPILWREVCMDKRCMFFLPRTAPWPFKATGFKRRKWIIPLFLCICKN